MKDSDEVTTAAVAVAANYFDKWVLDEEAPVHSFGNRRTHFTCASSALL